MTLYDMHCHLDFFDDMQTAAAELGARGVNCLSMTVTPRDYERASAVLGGCPSVRVALGLHPWWIADGRCAERDIALFEELALQADFIGEVGLDFGRRCEGAAEVQRAAFGRVLSACGGKVVSLHAVKAADEVLDALERYGALAENACILHWFSGSSDQLKRAANLGCYFSVSARMLASKRGREYAKALPASRMLLETDEPSENGDPISFDAYEDMLSATLETIEHLRGERVAAAVEQTSERLFCGKA